MNLNDNGTEIQSQIANMTKTGLTILLLSHFNKLSTTKGRSETNIRCQEMCKQPAMFWSNMCFETLAWLLSKDERNTNCCSLFWLKGDFCENFKHNKMKKWGKIDSCEESKQQLLKTLISKPFILFSQPVEKTIQKIKATCLNTSKAIRNFSSPVQSIFYTKLKKTIK